MVSVFNCIKAKCCKSLRWLATETATEAGVNRAVVFSKRSETARVGLIGQRAKAQPRYKKQRQEGEIHCLRSNWHRTKSI